MCINLPIPECITWKHLKIKMNSFSVVRVSFKFGRQNPVEEFSDGEEMADEREKSNGRRYVRLSSNSSTSKGDRGAQVCYTFCLVLV